MTLLKWAFVVFGMFSLLAGLNIQSYAMLSSTSLSLDFATYFYIAGAVLLIVPPLIEMRTAKRDEDREFAKLLVVLEVFLVLSGILFFWKGDVLAKVVVRIGASLMVTAYLKYGLKQLPEFRWAFFYNPLLFAKYHWDCASGKYGPAYPLSLGIDWLGIGYAFLAFSFGKAALLLGSSYLLISAWRGYRATGAGIPLAWTAVNVSYVCYGTFFLAHALL